MTIINEGRLRFQFPDGCRAIKYDDTSYYRNQLEKAVNLKAVDIIVSTNKQSISFIEIKDFRGHAIENKKRLKSGELACEVAEKFAHTLAGLVGAYRTEDSALFGLAVDCLKRNKRTMEVILFLQEDKIAVRLHPSKKRRTDQLDLLRRHLKPFGVAARIANLEDLPTGTLWSVCTIN